MSVLVAVPALLGALACIAGARRVSPRSAAIAIGVVGAVVAIAVIVAGPAPGVLPGKFAEGVLVASVLVVMLPLAVYYGIGRALKHWLVVAVVWVGSLIPLAFWMLFGLLAVSGLTECAPNAYECPV